MGEKQTGNGTESIENQESNKDNPKKCLSRLSHVESERRYGFCHSKTNVFWFKSMRGILNIFIILTSLFYNVNSFGKAKIGVCK